MAQYDGAAISSTFSNSPARSAPWQARNRCSATYLQNEEADRAFATDSRAGLEPIEISGQTAIWVM
jgi:hypothetical protein